MEEIKLRVYVETVGYAVGFLISGWILAVLMMVC